jgi:hypothetical protein
MPPVLLNPFLSAAAAASYSAEVLADSPWGFWEQAETTLTGQAADSGSNATAFDYVPGTTSGKAALLSDGGKAVAGLGTDAIARLASVPASLNGSNVSMEAWVKIPAANVQGPFINLGTYASNGWAVGVGGTTMDNAGHQLILLNENIAWIQTGFTLTAGVHHIVVVRGTSGSFTVYVDGTSVYTTTFTPNTPTGAVTIGGATSAARSLSSTVDVDNVALFASALSAARVTAHYNSGAGDNTAIAADSPVIWLKLDDVTMAADSSTNARPLSFGAGPALTPNQTGPGTGHKAISYSTAAGYARTPVAVTQPTTATYEFWIKIAAAPAAKTEVIAFGGSGGSGAAALVGIDTAGKVVFDLYTGSSVPITAPSALSLNTWHHVVCSVGAAGAKIRIDKTTVVSSGTTSVVSAVSGALYVRNGGPVNPGGSGAMVIALPAAWYNTQLADARTDAHYDAA